MAKRAPGGKAADLRGEQVPPNRWQRRKMNTRAKLLEAGRRVFAEKGVDVATIHDITEAADVGRGSFYNFFETKEELVEAITDELAKQMVELESALAQQPTDPRVALAETLRYAFRILLENPAAAWFAVRTGRIESSLFLRFHDATRTIIDRGRDGGVFAIEDSEIGVVLVAGIMLAALEGMLLGLLPTDSTDTIVEYTLRTLGVPNSAARRTMTFHPAEGGS